jgi:hypothetical protein
MTAKLEHANLCVRDIDVMIRFLQTAFPEFRIRADRTDADGSRWVHVGTDEVYLALSAADSAPARPWEPYSGLPGFDLLLKSHADVVTKSAGKPKDGDAWPRARDSSK